MAYEDVLRELDILIESNKDTLERFIKQLNFVYNNLSDNHPLKESMRKYIDYVENEQGVSGIKTNEATRLYHVLEDAGLIKDRSGEELWKQIQERETGVKITAEIVNFSGKVGDVIDGK